MVEEIEYQTNGQPVHLDFDDLKEKLGYKVYKPRIGNLGRALIKASKEGNQRSVGWMKPMLDELFKKQRQAHKNEKRKFNDSKFKK